MIQLPLLLAIDVSGIPFPILVILTILACMVILGIGFAFVKSLYKRCSSNQVLVVYGAGTGRDGATAKTVHGGGAFVWPLIQDYEYLSLEPIQIEIPLRGALSIENIRVNVPSVFTVAIGTEPEVMQNAAIRLLGLSDAGDPQAGRGHHLRPVAPGDRLDADRGHQPRPRHVPGAHPELARARAARRSAWC